MITKSKNNVVYVDNPADEIEVMRIIVKNQQFATVKTPGDKKGILVDLWTASAVVYIYDQLSEKSKEKLATMPLARKINECYKLINRIKEGRN